MFRILIFILFSLLSFGQNQSNLSPTYLDSNAKVSDRIDDLMNRKAVRKPKDWHKTDKDGGSSKEDKKYVTDNDPEIGSAVEEI